MEKKVIIAKTKEKIIRILAYIMCCIIYFGLLIIYLIHYLVPFFPVLFLFDFCMLLGYPLFLRFILKKKWLDCTKNDYLRIKYIFVPWLLMMSFVFLYYLKETLFVLQTRFF